MLLNSILDTPHNFSGRESSMTVVHNMMQVKIRQHQQHQQHQHQQEDDWNAQLSSARQVSPPLQISSRKIIPIINVYSKGGKQKHWRAGPKTKVLYRSRGKRPNIFWMFRKHKCLLLLSPYYHGAKSHICSGCQVDHFLFLSDLLDIAASSQDLCQSLQGHLFVSCVFSFRNVLYSVFVFVFV